MSVIWVTVIEVLDSEQYAKYSALAMDTPMKYGGRPFKRGKQDLVEGEPPLHLHALLEFPSLDAAWQWYNSPEYAKAREVRGDSARVRSVFLEGSFADPVTT